MTHHIQPSQHQYQRCVLLRLEPMTAHPRTPDPPRTLHEQRDDEAAVDVHAPRVSVLHAAAATEGDELQQRVHELLALEAQAICEVAVVRRQQPERARRQRCVGITVVGFSSSGRQRE